MKVFSIIVVFNGMKQDWIKKCFTSLQQSTLTNVIIAVDNGSTDKSVEYIREEFPEVILIEAAVNLGFGKANNIGMEYALNNNADYVFLLNQDAFITSETIGSLVKVHKQNNDYGIISPIHLNGTGTALDFNFSNYIVPSNCKDLYSDFVLGIVEHKVYESDFICAAAWLISRKCLEVVGGFSPTFFHYAEDDNYVHRLHYKGLKIGVHPFSTIYHDRENRKNNPHQDQAKTEERLMLLKYSNPNKQYNLELEKKHLKRILLKSKLLNQTDTTTYVRNKISLIDQHADQIIKNLNTSKSDRRFAFLNFDSN